MQYILPKIYIGQNIYCPIGFSSIERKFAHFDKGADANGGENLHIQTSALGGGAEKLPSHTVFFKLGDNSLKAEIYGFKE